MSRSQTIKCPCNPPVSMLQNMLALLHNENFIGHKLKKLPHKLEEVNSNFCLILKGCTPVTLVLNALDKVELS